MSTAPHCPAAFINAIHDDGTKEEAVKFLQETWNELVQARTELRRMGTLLKRCATVMEVNDPGNYKDIFGV
jgi:hypothetical protein